MGVYRCCNLLIYVRDKVHNVVSDANAKGNSDLFAVDDMIAARRRLRRGSLVVPILAAAPVAPAPAVVLPLSLSALLFLSATTPASPSSSPPCPMRSLSISLSILLLFQLLLAIVISLAVAAPMLHILSDAHDSQAAPSPCYRLSSVSHSCCCWCSSYS